MDISIAAILIGGLLSVGLTYVSLWKYRRPLALLVFAIFCIASLSLLYLAGNRLWAIVVVAISLYQLFNMYRAAYSRVQIEHLRQVVRKTAIRLWVFQLLVTLLGALLTNIFGFHKLRWIVLSCFEALMAIILYASAYRHKKITKRIQLKTELVDSRAPTLTVAIPARNETDDLYECLLSLIQCDYPKLEILVLDDQSTTKRTPEIIRSFAQEGVEFIAGKTLEQGWLAKNWAYQQLLEAANGEIVLFCGADTRFSKEALRFLVSALINRNKSVVSILPKNNMPAGVLRKLLQPLRYCWEICLPRRYLQRPPVLSTCWLAKRNFLVNSGGFKAVSRRVVCESYFARTASIHDGYSFFQYDGIVSTKKNEDQLETAIRLRYPQLHRQPELVALVTVFEIAGMLGSLMLCVSALAVASWVLACLSGFAVIVFALTFGLVSGITYRRPTLVGYIVWPLACLMDLYLLHLSMWRYEFGTVLWKGRSVAPPGMHSDVS